MATSVSVAMNLVAKELDGSIPLLTASMTDWRKDSKRRRVVGSAGWGGWLAERDLAMLGGE